MAAEFTNIKNRGVVLAFISMSSTASFVVGPLLFGYIYTLDIRNPFYACAVTEFIAALIMVAMLVKWPELRRPKKVKTDDAAQDEEWTYVADTVSKKDYTKLGKGLGTMLSRKHYLWVSNMDGLFDLLDTMFPEMPVDSVTQCDADTIRFTIHKEEDKAEYEYNRCLNRAFL